MALANSDLWGSLLPGGDAGTGGIDTQEVLDRILPTLHADTRADLTFWTEADLIAWMDEALKRLARIACVFVGRDASIQTVIGQAAYTLPTQHVSTIHVSRTITPLRSASQADLEALDSAYQTTAGTPSRWYEDRLGNRTIALQPVPVAVEALPIIYGGWPSTLDGGGLQTLVAAPVPIKAYLEMCVLAEAYGREGEAEMPDVAKHCRSQVEFFDKIFASYYGPGI